MLFIYITRLASNEIFSPSNEINLEVGRAKDLSAPVYQWEIDGKSSRDNTLSNTTSGSD